MTSVYIKSQQNKLNKQNKKTPNFLLLYKILQLLAIILSIFLFL